MASTVLSRCLPSFRSLHNVPSNFGPISRLTDASIIPLSSSVHLLVADTQGARGARLQLQSSSFHTTSGAAASQGDSRSPSQLMDGPRKWPSYNTLVLPPQEPEEPRRAAQCFHYRTQMKHGELKLWYAASMIRGLSIDDALNQLAHNNTKAAHLVKEVLLEAQEIALRDHNFEFKTKMWVAESYSGRGIPVKGFRRHGKGRFGHITYKFSHYFVKLEEGDPPKHYYPAKPTIKEQIQEKIEELRSRRIYNGL